MEAFFPLHWPGCFGRKEREREREDLNSGLNAL